MTRILIITAYTVLTVFGQRIETQKADRTKIIRLATTQNHLSVLEFNEPVKEVAVGSSNFKVEWRENKVFVQPLEPNAATNLFVWTASGRQSYELFPAGSVDDMHFAIDEDPSAVEAKREEPSESQPVTEPPAVPTAMLMEGTPVKVVGASKNHQKVEIIVQDVYRKDGRIYLRYAIVNGSRTVYLTAPPEVSALWSPRAPQSLISLANSQLGGDFQLRWKGEHQVPLIHTVLHAAVVEPGQVAHGVIAFELPSQSDTASERAVVKLTFPADGAGNVSAVLVL